MSWVGMSGEEDPRFAWDVQLDIKEEVKEENEGVPEAYIKEEIVENIKDEVVAELFVKEEPFDLSVTENKVCFNSQPCLSTEHSSSSKEEKETEEEETELDHQIRENIALYKEKMSAYNKQQFRLRKAKQEQKKRDEAQQQVKEKLAEKASKQGIDHNYTRLTTGNGRARKCHPYETHIKQLAVRPGHYINCISAMKTVSGGQSSKSLLQKSSNKAGGGCCGLPYQAPKLVLIAQGADRKDFQISMQAPLSKGTEAKMSACSPRVFLGSTKQKSRKHLEELSTFSSSIICNDCTFSSNSSRQSEHQKHQSEYRKHQCSHHTPNCSSPECHFVSGIFGYNEKAFVCNQCFIRMKSKLDLVQHVTLVHKGLSLRYEQLARKYFCSNCRYITGDQDEMVQHRSQC